MRRARVGRNLCLRAEARAPARSENLPHRRRRHLWHGRDVRRGGRLLEVRLGRRLSGWPMRRATPWAASRSATARAAADPGPRPSAPPTAATSATGSCAVDCTSDADCADGVRCVAGSCGPKRGGAVCTKDSECASGFCTDGVCCNVACRGACVTCNQAGRAGTCWPTDPGQRDPHVVCKDEGTASCGRTGACDGVGGCALYAAETMCVPPSCSAIASTPPGPATGSAVAAPRACSSAPPTSAPTPPA